MKSRIYYRLLIVGVVLFTILRVTDMFAQQADSTHECTQAMILGPLAPGLKYIDGSNPLLVCHKNNDNIFYVLYYKKGTQAAGGNYTYQHDFIAQGRDWNGGKSWDGTGKPPLRSSSMMNDMGCGFGMSNSNGGTDYIEVREEAAAMSDNYEELYDLVKSESHANTVGVIGYDQSGKMEVGYIDENVLTTMTPGFPFEIVRNDADAGKARLQDTANWFHGDPNVLEARDVAYCWHRFNSSSDAANMTVLKKKIIWCTAAPPSDSPFIPFDLNDPYVYPKFQDGSYYKSANYTQAEIDEIEDLIMAPDGSVIGDVRDIQMRIAEHLPLVSPTLSITSASLPDGVVGNAYNASLQASGGTTPYAWTLNAGKLPSGLNLSASGLISGTPVQAEDQTFTVQVKDAASATASKDFSIRIRTLTALAVNPNSAQVMNGRTQQFTAVGTDQYGNPITVTPVWSVDGGGVIDATGLFSANQSGGPFAVIAKAGAITGTATVTVSEAVAIVEANFDQNEENFTYAADPFRSTNQPGYSSGVWVSSGGYNGGALQVTMGGLNSDDIMGMSAGWRHNIVLNTPTKIVVSFRYNLSQGSDYESDEFSQVLLSVDNVLYGEAPNDYVAQVVGDGDGGSVVTTGWQLFEVNVGTLAAGEHRIIIGGYNNKKTNEREITEVLIDEVMVLDARVSAVFADDSQKSPNPYRNHNIPESFTLYQNYPNPFNPATTIAFDLPFAAKVKLNILDVLGRNVATILNGNLAAGSYKTNWNIKNASGNNLTSGVYFYQLEVIKDSYALESQKSFVVTKKMLLTK